MTRRTPRLVQRPDDEMQGWERCGRPTVARLERRIPTGTADDHAPLDDGPGSS